MKKAKKLLYSQKIAPYVFVVPFVLSLLIFWLYPLVSGISMSFQDVSFGGMKWVGAKHFKKLLGDKVFRIAVGNSLEYMVLTLLLMVPIPMLLAVLLESRLTKAKGVWKVIMYIPALTSVVISGLLFRLMFSEGDNGQLNVIMNALGKASQPWLRSKSTGWCALLLLCVWRWTGVNILYYVAGLKAIDTSLYESGDIDGANGWQKFRYITLPLLKGVFRTNITMWSVTSVGFFVWSQLFSTVTADTQTITPMVYLYMQIFGAGNSVTERNSGIGAAVGVMLSVCVVAVFWLCNHLLKDDDLEF